MRFNFPLIILAMAITFAALVAALTVFGGDVLGQLEVDNATVGYIDLARQARLRRDHAQAELMFERAIASAERKGPRGQSLAYALVTYANYLRTRQKPELADVLESRARHILHE